MAKLAKKYIKQAWKMKGSTSKNALKRAWALQKKANSGRKTPSTRKKSTSTTPRSKKMAKQKRIKIGLLNLAGLAASLSILDAHRFFGRGRDATPNLMKGDIAGAAADVAFNLKHTKKEIAGMIGGVMIAKMIAKGIGVKKVGGIGPLDVEL